MAENANIPVKYIGYRPVYREGAYGSGILFQKDETKLVPNVLAAKLLKHIDVYAQGKADAKTEKAEVIDKKPKDADTSEEDALQSIRDGINAMDKAALETWVKTQFKIDIDKRKGIDSLRAQANQLVDQYGVV